MSFKTTELCVLLVDETFGELPARIFKTLMTYGRQPVSGIARYTALTPSQIKHGLAVLIQQHLAAWSSGPVTFYEAYWPAAYALIRSGKFSRAARERLNTKAEHVLSKCLVDGNVKAVDLEFMKMDASTKDASRHENGINGTSHKSSAAPESCVSSIYHLLDDGVVIPSNISHFRPKTENLVRAERDVRARNKKWNEKIKPAERVDFQRSIDETMHSWKYGSKVVRSAIQHRTLGEHVVLVDEFKTIEAVHEENEQRPSKRLKTSHQEMNGSSFNSDLMIRANSDKYPVLARSQRLIQLAADRIGNPISKVYATVLHLLDKDMMQCNEFERDAEAPVVDDEMEQPRIETQEILEALEDLDSLRGTIGVPYNSDRGSDKIKSPSSVHQTQSNKHRRLSDADGKQTRTIDLDSDSDVVQRKRIKRREKTRSKESVRPVVNGKGKRKVTIGYDSDEENHSEEDTEDDVRLNRQVLQQHLLILVNHNLLTHHSKAVVDGKARGRERWSVPFAALSHELRLLEINTSIAAHFGTPALRIARILQEKGKVDEKTLIAQALLDTKIVRSTLTAMHSAGYMELQELPRDNNRAPSKTLYLWFFDEKRCAQKLLEDHYTAMSRCLQRLRAERARVRDLLEKSARSDVKGREQDYLTGEEWERMERWWEGEEKLLGELDRLDDAVLVLRDL